MLQLYACLQRAGDTCSEPMQASYTNEYFIRTLDFVYASVRYRAKGVAKPRFENIDPNLCQYIPNKKQQHGFSRFKPLVHEAALSMYISIGYAIISFIRA